MVRRLRCPRCSTINLIEEGDPPACASCGYGTKELRPLRGSTGVSFKPVPKGKNTTVWDPPPPSWWQATPMQVKVSAGLLGLGALLLALNLVGLLPWGSSFTRTFEQQHGMWGAQGAGPVPGGIESFGYWGGSAESQPGIWLLRLGGPLLALAMLAAVMATIGAVRRQPVSCSRFGWTGVGLAAAGTILFALGVDQQQQRLQELLVGVQAGTRLGFEWQASFYIAVGTVAALATGSIMGPVPGQEPPQREEPEPEAEAWTDQVGEPGAEVQESEEAPESTEEGAEEQPPGA